MILTVSQWSGRVVRFNSLGLGCGVFNDEGPAEAQELAKTDRALGFTAMFAQFPFIHVFSMSFSIILGVGLAKNSLVVWSVCLRTSKASQLNIVLH